MVSTGVALVKPRAVWLLAGVSALAMLGLLIADWPEAAIVGSLLIWAAAAILSLPVRLSVGVPILTLLVIPADDIVGLNGAKLGLFVVVAAGTLAAINFSRWQYGTRHRLDWDFYLLAGVLIGATLSHAGYGELRGLLFWIAAGLLLYWLRSEGDRAVRPDNQAALAICVAGSLGGLFGLADYLGFTEAYRLIPGYVPRALEFSANIGTRAAGLSGHPLRLGTITMLSSLIAAGYLTDDRLRQTWRRGLYVMLGLSLVGLLLSGARGAWLSFIVALIAMGLSLVRKATFRRVGGAVVKIAVGALVIWATGLYQIVSERLFGSAFHAASIDQRLQALQSVGAIWSRLPLLGVGFGGAAELTGRVGLRLPNLENEYLRFFLTAGLLGPLTLLLVGTRRILRNMHRPPSRERIIALGTMTGMLVNAATYNVFSWSAGASLFAAVAFLSIPRDRAIEAGTGDEMVP